LSRRERIVFRPFSLLYLSLLVGLYLVTVSAATSFLRNLLVSGVGLPPEAFGAVLFVSLLGSFMNVPLTELETRAPIVSHRRVRLFWVTWRVPRVVMGVRKTLVTINLGGAIVPVLISAYLLLVSIPGRSPDIAQTYVKTLLVLLIVTLTTYRSARLVKGLGIATPAMGPPLTTALATTIIHVLSPVTCPAQIAYVGGTLGTLIGADLMNIRRLPELGAPVVSIGGAGTFDGIYITGLVSVLLVTLLL